MMRQFIMNADGEAIEEPNTKLWYDWMEANKKPLAEVSIPEGTLVAGFLGIADKATHAFAVILYLPDFKGEIAMALAGSRDKILAKHAEMLARFTLSRISKTN